MHSPFTLSSVLLLSYTLFLFVYYTLVCVCVSLSLSLPPHRFCSLVILIFIADASHLFLFLAAYLSPPSFLSSILFSLATKKAVVLNNNLCYLAATHVIKNSFLVSIIRFFLGGVSPSSRAQFTKDLRWHFRSGYLLKMFYSQFLPFINAGGY